MQQDGTFCINKFLDSIVYLFRSRYARVAQLIVIDLVSSEFLCLLQSVGEEFADDARRCAIAIIFSFTIAVLLYNDLIIYL